MLGFLLLGIDETSELVRMVLFFQGLLMVGSGWLCLYASIVS